MTAPADMFDEIEPYESFDGLEFADEKLPFVPGRRVFSPGGVASATLHTPKGPAKLSLPSPVATLTQYRNLEQTVNSLTQRLNATNAQLLQVRRELATRPRDAGGGMGSMGMILSMITTKKLREDLEKHTHDSTTGVANVPGGGSKLDSILPLLLLAPNMFGGAMGGQSTAGGQDAMSPLMLLLLLD